VADYTLIAAALMVRWGDRVMGDEPGVAGRIGAIDADALEHETAGIAKGGGDDSPFETGKDRGDGVVQETLQMTG